jgi:hypothetical protein
MHPLVEDNIPVPAPVAKTYRYPFRNMTIGQSVWYPAETCALARQSAYSMAYGTSLGSRPVMKFVWAREEGGMRFWRTA